MTYQPILTTLEPGIVSVQSATQERDQLYRKFASRSVVNPQLDRTLVSYQASKHVAYYNWFKYKEGFSPALVEYLIKELFPNGQPETLLDPFAGSGSALFAARKLGWKTFGIELLPVGIQNIKSRITAETVVKEGFRVAIKQVLAARFKDYAGAGRVFNHIAITKGAFPPDEESELLGYLNYCQTKIASSDICYLLEYAAFCGLEAISYTRKDGQYLRWDYRSGRSQGKKPFDKGPILTFRQAITEKLNQIADDLEGVKAQYQFTFDLESEFATESSATVGPLPELYEGSCLDVLPTLAADSINLVITSPPYCNRYDYTRTYALELVFLGCTDEKVKALRQAMLSCTVENRSKQEYLRKIYAESGLLETYEKVNSTFQNNRALQEVLAILERYKQEDKLNNAQVVKMVHNYFYEMAFTIYELARILKPGGKIAMVNDNVQYAGEEIPVDLILSEMAEAFGLHTEIIWALERGKGNSSQQMGQHGRSELRKCVYVWGKQA